MDDRVIQEITAQIYNLPQVKNWPEMGAIIERAAANRYHLEWDLPFRACRAAGGDAAKAIPATASLVCMQCSIILVDDMLDEDPRGQYRQLGWGTAANLALAFQAAAFAVVERSSLDDGQQKAITANLAQMGLATAFGQNLDVQNLPGEENYWRVMRAKSPPFFGSALYIGAIAGNARPENAEGLHKFGRLTGEVVQIYDDLMDALQSPACPDWKQGRNNLPILYARTADHPRRAEFEALLPQIDDPEALETAQSILTSSGAVSYCAYQVIQRYRAAQKLLDTVILADPTPMRAMLARYVKPLTTLLADREIELPPELQTEH